MSGKPMKKTREIQYLKFRIVINSREIGKVQRNFKNVFYSFSCMVGYMSIYF